MSTDTDALVAFLRARLDEDERAALAAKNETGRWQWSHDFGGMCNDPECPYGMLQDQDEHGTVLMQVHGLDVTDGWQGAEHIVRHDPARVLREVAAKRKTLQRAVEAIAEAQGAGHWSAVEGEFHGRSHAYQDVLRDLAEHWADHEDYQESWQS